MDIIQCKNKEEAAIKAANALSEYFEKYIDSEVLFLFCGGSGIKMLDNIKPESLSEKLTVTILDSRLSVEPKDENYNQLIETDFYKNAFKKNVKFINPNLYSNVLENIRISEAGEQFDKVLKNWISNHQNAKIIASIGMGPDGHIAGIIPFPKDQKTFDELFKNETRLALAYEVPSRNQFPKRLTTTYSFFSKIDRVVSYITGPDKRPKLLELASSKIFSENQFPGIILRKLNQVSIFTDIKQ